MRGDHYLLRRPSPGETLGGGVVVDPQPAGRHKRFDAEILQQLETLAQGSPAELLLRASVVGGPLPLRELAPRSRLPLGQVDGALAELLNRGQLVPLENGSLSRDSDVLVIARAQWEDLLVMTQKVVQEYHRQYPLRPGIPREELKSKLKLTPRTFSAWIKKANLEGLLVDANTVVAMLGHAVRFSPPQQARINTLLAKFIAAPYAPPSSKECQAEVGEEVFNALIALGQLEQVSAEVVFRRQDYDALLAAVRRQLEQEGTLTVAQFRDRFNTSRRYALAFLEHLDAISVTRRDGDLRRLR
jgi:selenocysteine-specific elongation factor